MSVDYRLKIHRNEDDKLIGIVNANHLKTIFDSEFASAINCGNGRNSDNVKFNVSELNAVATQAEAKIDKLYGEICEKKLLTALAKNVSVKRELEEDIVDLKDVIKELQYVVHSAEGLIGMIGCVVEDLWDKDDKEAAYSYNGKDLPKSEDGCSKAVFIDDVYCVIEANY